VAGPTFVDSSTFNINPATAANYTLARPAGVAEIGAGVVLLAWVRRRTDTGTPPTPTMPGWTAADDDVTNFSERFTTFYKTATAAEPTTYTVQTGVSGGSQEAVITAWTNCYAVGAGSLFVGQAASTGTTMSSPAITPPTADSVGVSLFMSHAASINSSPGGIVRVQYGVKRYVVISQTFTTTTSGQHQTVPVATGSADNWVSTFVLKPFNRAPYKPLPVAPVSGAAADLAAAGSKVSWSHSDPDGPQDSQKGYRLKRTPTDPAGAAQWWDGSAWQSTEQNVTSTVQSVTFAAGKWTNGTTYSWSVATQDQAGTWGPYSDLFVVSAASAPVVTVTAPSLLVTDTNRPPVVWTYSQAQSHPQTAWEAKITPAFEDTVLWSASGTDASLSAPVTVDLDNGGSYRAYARAAQTGGLWSPWDYEPFDVSVDPPATPDVATVPVVDETGPHVEVQVQDRNNLLSEAQASMLEPLEWQARANATAEADGAGGLLVTSVAAGNAEVEPVDAIPVAGGGTYTAMATYEFVAGTAPGAVELVVEEYNDQGDVVASTVVASGFEESSGDPDDGGGGGGPTTPTATMYLSLSPDRSGRLPLSFVTPTTTPQDVTGAIYVFVEPDNPSVVPTSVTWRFNDPERLAPALFTDQVAPFDLAGGSTALAAPFDTAALNPDGTPKYADGIYTVTADLEIDDAVVTVTGTLNVKNSTNTTYGMYVSPKADRSGQQPIALSNGTNPADPLVFGSVAFFVSPGLEIQSVAWYVGASISGTPFRTATSAPWDLQAGGTTSTAVLLDSHLWSDGTQHVSARVTTTRGRVVDLFGSFTVQNTVSTTYKVQASASPARTSPVDVASSTATVSDPTLTGNQYIFVSPTTNVAQVDWWLDDMYGALLGHPPYRTERAAPFDLVGGTATAALPLDTSSLSNGTHHVGAIITFNDGRSVSAYDTFTVSNASSPPSTSLPTPPPTLEQYPYVLVYYNNPAPNLSSENGTRARMDIINSRDGSTVKANVPAGVGLWSPSALNVSQTSLESRDFVHLLPGRRWRNRTNSTTFTNTKQTSGYLAAPYGIGPSGGRHHVIVGGGMDRTKDWLRERWSDAIGGRWFLNGTTYTGPSADVNSDYDHIGRMMRPGNWRGHLYIEGVEFKNSAGVPGDYIVVAGTMSSGRTGNYEYNAATTTLTIQNHYFAAVTFQSLAGPPWNGNPPGGDHDGGDWLQFETLVDYFNLYNVTGSSAYQAMYPNAGRNSQGVGWPKGWTFGNVNINQVRNNWKGDTHAAHEIFNPGIIKTFNGEARSPFPIDLTNCYSALANNTDAELRAVLGGSQGSSMTPTVSGGVATFPANKGVTGVWTRGNPPSGPFVVPGVNCGPNYVSPNADFQ
jgi:hypothetical protein